MTILPAKVSQRITFPDHNIFDFRDENGVIAGILRTVQTTLEICQGFLQDWRAMGCSFEPRARFFRVLMLGGRLCVVFGDWSLMTGQDIHSEPFAGVQVRVCSSTVIDAYQYEHGIERD